MLNLDADRYGALECIAEAPRRGYSRRWYCLCDCGNTTTVDIRNLRSGRQKSCGKCAYKRYRIGSVNETHKQSKTRLYRIYRNMLQRCYNHKHIQYKDWGGRGVAVCNEWTDSFEVFYEWAILNGYSDKLTIERKNNNLNYSPDNCTWATYRTQARNRTITKLNERSVGFIKRYLQITTMTQHEIGALFGVRNTTISAIATGRSWNDIEAISE